MSDLKAPVKGRAVCDARAAACRCVKDAEHGTGGDEIHACDPSRCTGQWKGDFDDESTFVVVTMPRAVGPARPWDFS